MKSSTVQNEQKAAQSNANAVTINPTTAQRSTEFEDNRPVAANQRLVQKMADAVAPPLVPPMTDTAVQLKRYNPWGDAGAGNGHRIWMRTAGAAAGKAYPKAGTDKAHRSSAMAETSKLIADTVGKGEVPSPLGGENVGSWVDDADKLNKSAEEEPKLDPFCVEFSTNYNSPTEEDQDAKTAMKTVVHFGSTFPGYVVSQSEGAHKAHMEAGIGGEDDVVYGTDHVDTGDSALATVARGTKEDSTEPTANAWEVRTSIMGEGARFQPVKELNLAGTLTKSTRFYFTATDLPFKGGQGTVDGEKQFYFVAQMMYRKWGQVFDGGYNLSKAQMVTRMKAAINAKANTEHQITSKLGIVIGAPGGGAYNLDA